MQCTSLVKSDDDKLHTGPPRKICTRKEVCINLEDFGRIHDKGVATVHSAIHKNGDLPKISGAKKWGDLARCFPALLQLSMLRKTTVLPSCGTALLCFPAVAVEPGQEWFRRGTQTSPLTNLPLDSKADGLERLRKPESLRGPRL